MLPGPDQIIACPHCKGLARYMTPLSGNTFGAQLWTDGKQIAPMLPTPPAVVKCQHCGKCYWLEHAEEVGTVDRWGSEDQQVDAAWSSAEVVQEPAEEDYYLAIENGLAQGREKEKILRILAWWRRNDVFRSAPDTPANANPDGAGPWRKNLESLAHLLGEGDETESLMKAELLRELGEFEIAKGVLGSIRSRDVVAVVRQMNALCDRRDTRVRQLKFES